MDGVGRRSNKDAAHIPGYPAGGAPAHEVAGKGEERGGGEGGKKETRLTGDGSTFSPP